MVEFEAVFPPVGEADEVLVAVSGVLEPVAFQLGFGGEVGQAVTALWRWEVFEGGGAGEVLVIISVTFVMVRFGLCYDLFVVVGGLGRLTGMGVMSVVMVAVRVRVMVRIGIEGLLFKMDVLGRGVEILRHRWVNSGMGLRLDWYNWVVELDWKNQIGY